MLAGAFAIQAQEGMTAEVSRTLNNMAMISFREKNYQGAIKQYRELVVWDRRTGNLQGVAIIRQTIMSRIYEHHLTRPQMARRSYPKAPSSGSSARRVISRRWNSVANDCRDGGSKNHCHATEVGGVVAIAGIPAAGP